MSVCKASLLEQLADYESFGIAEVQRCSMLRFPQARRLVGEMDREGLIESLGEKPWGWRVTPGLIPKTA